MTWYILQTNSQYEAKVITGIEQKIRETSLPIREIFSPMGTTKVVKDGVVKEKAYRLFPTYIFLEMDYDDSIWHSLRGIRGVVKIIGNGNRPTPVPLKEVEEMKKNAAEGSLTARVPFKKDDLVRIVEGSFNGCIGNIIKIDEDKNKVTVNVTVFNRETPVDIDMGNLEKVE